MRMDEADELAPLEVHALLGDRAVADAVAAAIAEALARALVDRGRAAIALSGGSTPIPMYHRLAQADLDWSLVHVLQVDERVAPDGHPDRNWGMIAAALVEPTGATGHPMPVDPAPDPAGYAAVLAEVCDGVLDVVHLGLGADGHTASLVPRDPVLAVADADVALTGPYRGRRRLTLTIPAIDRARTIVWQVVGAAKAAALAGVLAGDPALPGSLVRRDGDVRVYADEAAL
jgi:6-phosphogluconolactonase